MKTQQTTPTLAEQVDALEQRLAQRLAALRIEHGWTLDELAQQSGVSRATLSRLENCETSPTANILGKLCAVYGLSMSRILAGIDEESATLIPAAKQAIWIDPQSGFQRRMVSPASRGFKMEVTEITLPPKATVSYDMPTVYGTELHLWMLQGRLDLTLAGTAYQLKNGDCLRFHMSSSAHFSNPGSKPVRYALLSGDP
jgi:transcriptional regulator with XRE-family HTH domain